MIYTPYSRVILFIIGEYMKQTNIEARIAEINNRIAELPKGNISYHIKFSDRFDTLMQIEERRRLEDEKHLIEREIEACRDLQQVADRLGISRQNLNNKIKEYSLDEEKKNLRM